ncbi:Glycine cleavage system transcriptional activator [Marinomonas aquimarina]|uniref:Glycine cleavage system transcriptional activator n=1 Tax=Marinomonas aquimarina TaxID=295068 RepID=A0A1A8THL0_9GAMM|nr:LysR family transcriptional regulator [Marinomonas aquimarina]SBS32161.1 Glycine cleavage system transcriptional activator [Marinomonas aquimarina]
MANHIEPDQILVKMPSLRAVKSFVAAAKYQNFTRAAESLCVTQAAISRQIRELEASLGVDLFVRSGRTVELTEAGTMFYDAAYLSFVNIAQAAQRIQNNQQVKQELSVCCSPAFSSFWLSLHLGQYLQDNPDVHVSVISTSNLLSASSGDPGVTPDLLISKINDPREGYHSVPLFHDIVYPVCSPEYLQKHPEIESLQGLRNADLLNLTPYGRYQVAEHVDWEVWLRSLGMEVDLSKQARIFNANDYNMLIQLAISGQGVSLGWHHLVERAIAEGKLVRVGKKQIIYKEKCHYLTYPDKLEKNEAFVHFRTWLMEKIQATLPDVAIS